MKLMTCQIMLKCVKTHESRLLKIPQKDALSFVDMADSTCILTQGILYVEINHLRKAEPIQLYQILNKDKTLKNSKHVLFITFLKFEAKFDTQC